jgi:D-glycero-D-manno-heptose 1,7-bisphosphate phosphatase
LEDVPLVGDSLKDMEAALAVGARPILVLTGKGRQTAASFDADMAQRVAVVDDLAHAVRSILAGDRT